jgi:hypothetical protein
MKKLEVSHLVISFVILVVLGTALYFLVGLKNQVAAISEELVSSRDQMTNLQEGIILSNGYAKQNKKVIDELKDQLNAVVSIMERGGSYDNSVSGDERAVTEAFPYVEIWMDKNYTINRSSEENGKGNLTWVIVYNGEVALQRNAEGEMSYTYFQTDKGAYVVYMIDFVDGQYRVISNVISYHIE